MGFADAVRTCFSNYVTFTGRAARSEYWFWVLFTVLVSVGINILGMIIGSLASILGLLFSLGTILPSLAVGIRRLHDIDRTGWWLLVVLVPVLGWIVLLVFACLPGTDGPNRFGAPAQPGAAPYGRLAA